MLTALLILLAVAAIFYVVVLVRTALVVYAAAIMLGEALKAYRSPSSGEDEIALAAVEGLAD